MGLSRIGADVKEVVAKKRGGREGGIAPAPTSFLLQGFVRGGGLLCAGFFSFGIWVKAKVEVWVSGRGGITSRGKVAAWCRA